MARRRRLVGSVAGRRVVSMLVVTAVFVSGLLFGSVSPAAAAPSWSVVASPSPAGPPPGDLINVSCMTATSCFAVGATGNNALIERWNGSTWSVVASPSMPSRSFLNDVSCPTSTACFAVGGVGVGPFQPLVERWNGTSWSIMTSASAFGGLAAVSCPSATSCWAAVSGSSSTGPQLLRYNGTSWSAVSAPNPAGASISGLSDVWCPGASTCVGVGQYETSSFTFKTLVERWNGTAWTIVASPNPSGASYSGLSGVHCVSTTNCVAVGSAGALPFAATLIERWNGTSWTIVSSPNPSGAKINVLDAVWCTSGTNCFAVGDSGSDQAATKTLVERWNGTAWAVVSSPNPGGATASALYGVRCASSTTCFAVGYGNDSLVEVWNGTTWAVVSSPNPSGGSASGLHATSCPGTSSCVGVGAYDAGAAVKTLTERWNGSTWSVVSSPNPSGAASSTLDGVSCVSTTSCFAVGTYASGSVVKTLTERWNGSTWSVVTSPNPSGATSSTLNGVSCPSATNCFAVGRYTSSGITKTLIERWNGAAWAIQVSPNPSASANQLQGVACASTTSCFAVGSYTTSGLTKTLTERWNGSAWSVVTSPNPSSATSSTLNGVSCPSVTNCFAVGDSMSSGPFTTLTERWNGTTWTITSSPNRASADNYLNALSCPATTTCFAVGESSDGAVYKTLTEQWNGTAWTIMSSPNPSTTLNELDGVSCAITTSCAAVGDSFHTSGQYTLAERYA